MSPKHWKMALASPVKILNQSPLMLEPSPISTPKPEGFDEEAGSKDPQSKEPNEQPELEDQNQNDPNAGEHADDSDWADVTNDEANNEPKKAGSSTVCIYLVMAQRARKFKKVQPKKPREINKSISLNKKNREIALLVVLNFCPVQKLFFAHF